MIIGQRVFSQRRVRREALIIYEVDVYADPVCPYAWIASRWLEGVAPSRPVELRHHVMSLRILNEGHHQETAYQANIARTAGPSRVFTAAAVHVGEGILRELYTAFGTRWFARWRRPPEHPCGTPVQASPCGLSAWTLTGRAERPSLQNSPCSRRNGGISAHLRPRNPLPGPEGGLILGLRARARNGAARCQKLRLHQGGRGCLDASSSSGLLRFWRA